MPPLLLPAACLLFALAAPVSGLEYMSFYGVNVTAQAGIVNLCIGDTTDVDAFFEATQGATKGMLRMPSTGIYADRTLDASWNVTLYKWAAADVLPRMKNGSVVGVFLGDEICCEDVGCLETVLVPITEALRSWLPAGALLYENECAGTLSALNTTIPAELDWISVDTYDGYGPTGGGGQEAINARALYDEHVFPHLADHQSAFVVPGVFACSNLTYTPLNASSASVVEKLDGYWQWAQNDSRVLGFNPWHFNYRSHPQHPQPCDMQLGAVDMPDVVAKLREIGGSLQQ